MEKLGVLGQIWFLVPHFSDSEFFGPVNTFEANFFSNSTLTWPQRFWNSTSFLDQNINIDLIQKISELNKFCGPKYLMTKPFLDQILLFTQKFWNQKYLDQTVFLTNHFLYQKIFLTKSIRHFWNPTFFLPKIFGSKIFSEKLFCDKIFFSNEIFLLWIHNFLWTLKSFGAVYNYFAKLSSSWPVPVKSNLNWDLHYIW